MEVRPLLSPEEIAANAGATVPFLRLPERGTVFAVRAMRLRQLAPGHALAPYLRFMALLADAQQLALNAGPRILAPSEHHLDTSEREDQAPLDPRFLPRQPVWRNVLRDLVRELAARADEAQQAALQALLAQSDDFLEAQASKLLASISLGLDMAAAPLIAAALQVYWTQLLLQLPKARLPVAGATSQCPCCASKPTSSILRIGGDEGGYRYLHCALCASEWHVVRVKCTGCESTKGIHYLAVDGSRGTVKAECCDECGGYLKIIAMTLDPEADPVADDIGSLTLDLMVEETGKHALGVNFFLLQADSVD